ncbi:patatin [Lysobacter sp. TY2-98]|uniref:patatin-like phospholipase family protein n=1 Tax=Lysobacter sp. TY2-98 TaxID=2290922 RepID=UPI000E205F4B|nr:patatin-like phospholipase family protein [Lysobacter sp. TY2-98]AXK71777.1 patatin [Lysobacter sp. TY2-98]
MTRWRAAAVAGHRSAMRCGRGVLCALVALLLAFSNCAWAGEPSNTAAKSCGLRPLGDTRPRIGLVLGGGGARGIAHVSVLRRLEELHIPIDCIAGTSMGSLVGGLYASGMSASDIEHLVRSTDWPTMFDDDVARPQRTFRRKQDDRDGLTTFGVGIGTKGLRIAPGLVQGERILALLERQTLPVSGIHDFDKLPIPFRAVATDVNTGEAVVLDHGSLAMAMRASMSLPAIFHPVEIDGHLLLDGGLVDQVPVDVARDMGADIVIAVDVGTPLEKLGNDASALQVLSQMSGMMTTANTRRSLATLGPRDVLITPQLGTRVATGDFNKAIEALDIGTAAAQAASPALARLTAPPETYASAQTARPARGGVPVVDFVRLDNQTAYADELLLRRMHVEVGKPVDLDRLDAQVLDVYGFGTFAKVTYEVVTEDGRTGIVLHAAPKTQGPNYLQFGLTHSSDFEGGYDTTLRAAILFAPINRLGGEGRVTVAVGSEPAIIGEYYQPLDLADTNVFSGRLAYENPNLNVFDGDGNVVARYDIQAIRLRLQLAHEFGRIGSAGGGVEFGKGRAGVEIGDPSLASSDFQEGGAYVFGTVDRLDSLFFPRGGYFATARYAVSRESLGADQDYAQFDFDAVIARSFGAHALQLGGRYHSTVEGELPLYARYRLGGLMRLAGFRINELTGQHYALMFAGYSYKLASLFGRAALVGSTLEYGNAWERRSDISFADAVLNGSLYVGFDSWLGPMAFGYGWREAGKGALFLEIGRTF